MKNYFIRLFNYNLFANRQINGLVQTRRDEKAFHLMTHLLAAEKIWLLRCKGVDTTGVSVWPASNATQSGDAIIESHASWIDYLNSTSDEAFEQSISYQNSTGAQFNMLLCDIIAHVINHGTHTRAQIGQILKRDEADKLPVTDYIYYLRDQNIKL